MFGKKTEKLETLKDLIGTRAGYIETVEMLELKGSEKDLFMRASLEVKKSDPNLAIIEQAHAILNRKSFQGEAGEDLDGNISNDDSTPSPKKKHPKAPSSNHTHKGDEPTSSRHASYASNTEGDVKNDINYGSLNYKPQRKSYIKYIAIAVVVVGVYFFMNSNTTTQEKNSTGLSSTRATTSDSKSSGFFNFSSDSSLLLNVEKLIEYERISKFNKNTLSYKIRVSLDDSDGFNVKITNVGKRIVYIDLVALMDGDEVQHSRNPSIKIEPGKSESYDVLNDLFVLKEGNYDRIEFLNSSTTLFTIDSKNIIEDQKMYYSYYRRGVHMIGESVAALGLRYLKGDDLKLSYELSFFYIERACAGGISDACVFRRQIGKVSKYKELNSMFSKKYKEIERKDN